MAKLAPLLLLFLSPLVGCGKSPTNPNGTLRIGNVTEPQTLDPHLMVDLQQFNIGRALFEGLVTLDCGTLEPIPAVAESWEISPDGLTYTFHLRPNCRWSDGSPIVAEDFVYSIRRALSPDFAAPMAELLFPILGSKEFYGGTAPWESVAVAATDDATLSITLCRPTPYFLSLLTNPVWSPVQRRCLERDGAATGRNSNWTRPGSMVSNGPYELAEWRVGDCVLLRKNNSHREVSEWSPDAVAFYPIGDCATEQNAFENGEIDITATIPPDRTSIDSSTVSEVESLGVFYYILRCDVPPLNNRHLRLALSLAIDRGKLCQLIGRDPRFAAGNLVPPGCGDSHNYEFAHGYDPERARRELSLAAVGKNSHPISIAVNGTANHKLIAQAIQEMWLKELGISIDLRCEEWKSFLITRRSGNFTVARGGWIGDYNDPTTFLNLFHSAGTNNFCRWTNGEYDRELDAAERELDGAKRNSHLHRAEEILLGEAPIIPLYFETNRHRISNRVSQWKANLLDYHLWQKMQLDGGGER
ncbi:MAG: peptide ABC transporter substrate-binding protein [Puniceicoccales bacterium]|jgi:oligopeptide transport system substrate-binding protein|nr:peptide ABC transporter substrate-binding protein [Puniceicoccales bacterium]